MKVDFCNGSSEGATAIDKVLLEAFPIVATPLYGKLEDMPGTGKRIVLGNKGIYIEAKSPVIHLRSCICECHIPHLGDVEEFIHLIHGKMSSALLRRFREMAGLASPSEAAGVVVWEEGSYQLKAPEILSADATHVSYEDVSDESLVLDLHSHGEGKAFFSATDDGSDLSRPGPYIAGVLGNVGEGKKLEVSLRIVVPPYLLPLQWVDFMDLVEFK